MSVIRRKVTVRVWQALRLLAFSDLHRDRRKARRLVELAASADVVIGAGDFASSRLGLMRTMDVLKAISKPTLLIPGNNETDTALWRGAEFPAARVLHGEATEIDGVPFFGLGAGSPDTAAVELRPPRGGGRAGARQLPGARRPRRPLTAEGVCRRSVRPPSREPGDPNRDRETAAGARPVRPHPRGVAA